MIALNTGLKRKFYIPIRNAYKNRLMKQQFIKNLQPTDVFLVGHPKSGNTWLSLMLAVLIEKNFNKKVNLNNFGEFIPSFHDRDYQIQKYHHLPRPRIFRNEAPRFPDLYPKTIYILRDPRAAYVSYYHHCVHDIGDRNWKIEDFLAEMLENGCIKKLEPYLIHWDKHVLGWLERSKKQPVIFVKYEEMIQDRYRVMKKVVDFVGIDCVEEDIQNAVQRGDFKSMREEEKTYGAAPYSGTKGEGGFFTRKGKVDSWKEELTAPLADRITDAYYDTMKAVQYL